MTAIDTRSTGTPFDIIRQARPDGSEFWSARSLMPLLGYPTWQHFLPAIDRAESAAHNQGHEGLFTAIRENGTGGRPREDYELTRFAAYLVAMNGDPRKPEVAAAQSYFAIKTREAEVCPAFEIPADYPSALRAAAEQAERAQLAEARVQELEPKAALADEVLNANGCYSMEQVAKSFGWGRNVMFRHLRKLGILQGNNLPYQRYAHHFNVVPGTYVNRKTGDLVPTATTWVRPSALTFLRNKLERVEP